MPCQGLINPGFSGKLYFFGGGGGGGGGGAGGGWGGGRGGGGGGGGFSGTKRLLLRHPWYTLQKKFVTQHVITGRELDSEP